MPAENQLLLDRRSGDGAFAGRPGDPPRPDATAWAILALETGGGAPAEVVATARDQLAAMQLADGRLISLPGHRGAYWPTALAVLAWVGSPVHREAEGRAVDALLATAGRRLEEPLPELGHDPTLQGWAWIENTYSWVEPTALAVLALRSVGEGEHARVAEGLRLLLDRQLPSGGWNYGNREVFGRELRPNPESTGVALAALAGVAPRAEVERSLERLRGEAAGLRSPLSLGWGLLGLSAWGERPEAAPAWVAESLAGADELFPFDTAELAILLCGLHAEEGLLRHLDAVRGSPA